MRKTHLIRTYAALALVVTGIGCAREEDRATPATEMTQAERDSAIAASRIPGAGAVGRALEVADSAQARADRLDEETE